MIVDLNPLPCMLAMDILKTCVNHGIELEKCLAITASHSKHPPYNLSDDYYKLDIPDKYITYILLKYGYHS